MKYQSFILAICVMLLSTVPYLIEDDCMNNCLGSELSKVSNNMNDTDCSDCCSPFIQCTTCSGFIVEKIVNPFEYILTIQSDQIFSLYKEKVTDTHYFSIWQPPKQIIIS